MTRKDFERIAQVFRVNRPLRVNMVWHRMLGDMCVELNAINPRFDEDKFREACNK
jgi:hypothetical protein